ncbi:ABC transporter ATP-binding protein [Nitratidesulfovibrio termitidis]|uniref:ABC transporter ATP-binding protein n=1 Tax=Nitratidesulfovibrio termitidis TaxID=42252 RepID=UPI0003FEADF4|nr:ABC transporter ATP-binding protein [Nitratidesulfovibrio termitidis]
MVLAVEGLCASYGEGDAAPGGVGLVAAAVGRAVGFAAGRRGTRGPSGHPLHAPDARQDGGGVRSASSGASSGTTLGTTLGTTSGTTSGTVFRGVTFSLAQGEMACLVGPSGVGKTTLLRVLAGLHPHDGGGFAVTPPDGHDDAVILVFQDYLLFPHLTVRDNVAFGLRARGLGRRQRIQRAGDMLSDFGIGELAHRYPAHLSAGQRQRVALARALVCNPALLLLDEPFANLDRTLRLEMAVYVRETVRRYGVTTLSVTHDLEEAFAVADRIGVMLDGRLAQFGAPTELYGQPVSLDVARFMGPVNVLDGPACTAFGLPLPGGCLCGGGDDCVPLALRPEGLVAIPDPDGPAVVTRAVFTGQVNRLTLAPARAAGVAKPGLAGLAELAGLAGLAELAKLPELPELVVHSLRADMPEGTRVRVELA